MTPLPLAGFFPSTPTSPHSCAPVAPPMPDAAELEAARRVATLTLEDLHISSSTSPPCSKLPTLLRRCLVLLPLLNDGDPILATRCRHGLLASLRTVLSQDPMPSLLPAIEVFAESLVSTVSGRQMRSCMVMANFASIEESRMFAEGLPYNDEHIMLELVCRHFISSLPDEGAFEVFLSALSWSGRAPQCSPKISFLGAFAMVQKICLSLPAVVQAHLLLLMSRCTSNRNLNLDMLAFEHAMNLYVRYLPALGVFNRIGGAEAPMNNFGKERPFSCCIKDTTEQKLRSQIYGLLSFCQLHSGDDLPIDENDIGRVIEENQHMVHEKFRKECTVFVKGILSSILCCAKQKVVLESDAEVSDEIICLAAVLRVMGSSILHILHHFSQRRSATGKRQKSYGTSCKEYNATMYKIIRLLGQYETTELYRYDLVAIVGKSVNSESASMLMLAHFASLSTCCLRRRLGFLWKDCIVMMLMATNLMFEEQSLGTFQLPIVSKESALICNTKEGSLQVSAQTKAISLQYKSIHKCHNKGGNLCRDIISLGTPQEFNSRVGKADGQAFFDCHPEYLPNKWTDIVDFVECEEDKDYSNTLKQLRKFRKFKYGKWVKKRQSKAESTMNILGLRSRKNL